MTFDFEKFKLETQDLPQEHIRGLRQILREEEIVQEWQEANPPEVDEGTNK